MTKEEAIEMWVIPALKNTWNEKRCNEVLEALEQESCDNCISREAVLDLCDSKDSEYKVCHFKEDVECLPPVQPKQTKSCYKMCDRWQRTGRWEYVQYDGNPNIGNWHCSECDRTVCGAITAVNPVYSYKYCPECGAKMQEV